MIQRFLFEIVKSGFETIRDQPSLVDDIFSQYDLPDTEIDAIKTALVEEFPTVKHQYARKEDEPPIISIVLGNESEKDHYLGDFAEQLDDGAEVVSSIWEHTYRLLIYTKHPDLTLYYYEILKAIFVTAPLEDCGLFQTHISGMDLEPDVRYIPAHLFARVLTFSANREFESVDRLIALTKAFKVRGISIDKAGSPSDVGGVKTLVTPYQLDDDDE